MTTRVYIRLIAAVLVLTAALLFISGCAKEPQTLGDIAYDVAKRHGYTVYIPENGVPTPYLVLTADYGGNVLLVREFLLDEVSMYSDYYGYYKDSIIDTYLNETFLPTIDERIRNKIVDTEVTISTESNLWGGQKGTEQIIRKVFTLSYTELGYGDNKIHCVEGKALKYFTDDYKRRIEDVVARAIDGGDNWGGDADIYDGGLFDSLRRL